MDEHILLAGGSTDITPDSPVPLAGYRDRPERWRAIASSLECNVIVFVQREQAVVLVQIDCLFPSQALKTALLSRISKSVEVILVASHTHFAPALDPTKPLLGELDQEYFQLVVDRLAGLIERLLSAVPTPAAYSMSRTRCNSSVYRRKLWIIFAKRFPYVRIESCTLPNESVPIDRDITVFSFFRPEGRICAVLWNWACHPVASPSLNAISADFVGAVRDSLRGHFGGEVPVLFLPGLMGDVRPNIVSRRCSWTRWLTNPFAARYFSAPVTPEQYLEFCRSIIECIPWEQHRSSNSVQLTGCLALKRTLIPLRDVLPAEGGEASIPLARLNVDSRLQFLFIGAEPSSGYATGIRARLRADVIPVGYSENVFGYLPLEMHLPEGGYEVTGFMSAFGVAGPFKTGFERRVLDALEVLR